MSSLVDLSGVSESDATGPAPDPSLNDISDRKRAEEELRDTGTALRASEEHFSKLIQGLPAAVYTTDAAGRITFYNEAAAELWGCRPELGKSEFCGSWKLYRPDGTPLPHDECPMALTLREQRPIRGIEAVAERPDGTRVPFMPYPTPLFDASGTMTGAVNMLLDLTERNRAAQIAQHLASIVENSDDAILTKDLEGVITSWNKAAERLFGYTARETVGRPVTMLIPPERHDEEPAILQRLRRGERIDHYETVRRRKDGALIDISLTVSPLRDAQGGITGASKIARDITERKRAEQALQDSETRFRSLFENVRVAVWEEDFSAVLELLDTLRAAGVSDLRSYFRDRPQQLAEAVRLVRVNDVNEYTLELFEADRKDSLLASLATIFLPETAAVFVEELAALWDGRRHYASETVLQTLRGRRFEAAFTIAFQGERCERTLVSVLDISQQKAAERAWQEQAYYLDNINRVAKVISSNLDLETVVQTVTDTATALCGAKFGAFFYNSVDQHGERYALYALSGAPREAFARFPMPRNTALFEATFRGRGVVRSDDVRTDPRYGRNAPHFGLPKGHLPVVSYLAVPVLSRSGEVHGGLFFGHDKPGVFSEKEHNLAAGIAVHAGLAIDNANSLRSAQVENERRRRAEEQKDLLLNEVKHRAKNTLATVQAIAARTFRNAPADEKASFVARLHALAHAHDLLSEENWSHASLRALVERALEPYLRSDDRRVSIEGPEVRVDASRALALTMVFHELATNAAKYGSLSDDEGKVAVEWQVSQEGRPRLRLSWRELDGPPVTPPLRKGFGSLLVERGLGGEGGNARFDFAPDGLVCTLEIDLEAGAAGLDPAR